MSRRSRSLILIAAASVIATPCLVWAQQAPIGPDAYRQLKYRYIGPVGNRIIAVAGLPSNPDIYYVGAASGGIFKTTDGGVHWDPIFDDQPVSSIGSLAIAPSDPNVIWAGTGETFIRSNISIGHGIYKSTDAGKTWAHMGLDKTGRIGRVVIDPRNPDIVFAAAMGHSYGPQPERGVFRTTDGGKTWEKVLFVDENTGCSEVAMDPNNPRILFAGMWQLEIHTWGRTSGGPGSGLYTSRDGGTTWKRLTGRGLPTSPVGKIAVAVARSNSNRVYALIETGDGVPWNGQKTESGQLWRSDDGGENWQVVSSDRNLRGRPHYMTRFAVMPDNENEAYFPSTAVSKTLDGGKTIVEVPGAGGDSKDIWIDPANGNRMVLGSDFGVYLTINRGRSWHLIELPVAQMYHVAVDNQIPYYIYGNRQDGWSTRGPSNSKVGDSIPRGEWHAVAGGESGFAVPDPIDNNIVWATGTGLGSEGGAVERYDERIRQARWVEIWPESPVGWPAADLKYRFNWTFPLAISPHDHNKVYAGSQFVHQTTDGGNSWQVISPDLTRNDKSRQQTSGGLTPDNIGVEYAGVIFALAESPLEKDLIWAGTNDGLVQVTRDAGAHWTNVTPNIPGLPAWGTVSNIEPSRYDAGTAYITVDLHQVNNRDPFVYKTADYGKTWTSISGDIPKTVFSYAHCVREDPVRSGLLYLGTENALYVSFNDGRHWVPLQTNLPHAPVHWIVVQEHFKDLVVATYGRGFWILDDITPLEQLTAQVLESSVHLFAPRAAYRFKDITAPFKPSDDPTEGRNPPYGASINYFLKSVPQGDVEIAILDGAGKTIRTLKGSRDAGINRVWWDLRYKPTTEIRLRTSPMYAPDVRLGPEGWRPFPQGGRLSVLAAPGTYAAKLTVGGQSFMQALTVRKDPNSGGSDADVEAQTTLMMALSEEMNAVADSINHLESIRSQVAALTVVLGADENARAIRASADELDAKCVAVEEHLFQMKVTGRGADMLRWPGMLAEKLGELAFGVSNADFAPTTQQMAVHEQLKQQVEMYRDQITQLVTKEVAAFNGMLRQRNVPNIVARTP